MYTDIVLVQLEPYPDGVAEPDHQLFDLQQQVVVGAVVLRERE